MYKIKAPVKGYTGTGYGLVFVNGMAETDQESTARYLAEKGYTVEQIGDVAEKEKRAEGMTVEELREFAAKNGIDLKGTTKKADILALIRASSISSEPVSEVGGDSKPDKGGGK